MEKPPTEEVSVKVEEASRKEPDELKPDQITVQEKTNIEAEAVAEASPASAQEAAEEKKEDTEPAPEKTDEPKEQEKQPKPESQEEPKAQEESSIQETEPSKPETKDTLRPEEHNEVTPPVTSVTHDQGNEKEEEESPKAADSNTEKKDDKKDQKEEGQGKQQQEPRPEVTEADAENKNADGEVAAHILPSTVTLLS